MKKTYLMMMSIVLMSLSLTANAAKKSSNIVLKGNNSATAKVLRSKKAVVKDYALADLTKNLEYAFAKVNIKDTYYDKLDQLAKLSIEKNYAIALRGHADAIGSFKGNWHVSQYRADAVKAYLVKKGVPENKIVATAFGSTKPIASNKTKQGRQKNRRVEIKIDQIDA